MSGSNPLYIQSPLYLNVDYKLQNRIKKQIQIIDISIYKLLFLVI
jgi:hypothetical protein